MRGISQGQIDKDNFRVAMTIDPDSEHGLGQSLYNASPTQKHFTRVNSVVDHCKLVVSGVLYIIYNVKF